jgi:hypothetical protein
MEPPDEASTSRRFGRLAAVAIAALAIAAALAVLLNLGPFENDGTLTRAEFVQQGDEICKEAHDQFAENQKRPPDTASAAAALTESLIAISENELNDIRNLDAPSEVQSALDRYLAAREEGIALLRKGLEAAQKKDARAFAAAQANIAATQVKRLRLAQQVGFSECSRPIAGSSASGG